MSKIITEKCNFIVIGAWNPAIIQPQWLKKEFPTLIPENFNVQVVAGVVSSFRIEFPDEFVLDPNGGRLVFIPKKMDDTILNKIADLGRGIHKALSHTPIAAAGCNYVFKLEQNEFFKLEKIETDEEIDNLYQNIGRDIVARSIRHVISEEAHTINLNYEFKGMEKELHVNFNYPGQLDSMKVAADSLLTNYQRAKDMCKELIGEK
jgi:hypothetical protein